MLLAHIDIKLNTELWERLNYGYEDKNIELSEAWNEV